MLSIYYGENNMLFVPQIHSYFQFDSTSAIITPDSIEFKLSHDAIQIWDYKEILLHVKDKRKSVLHPEVEFYPLIKGSCIKITHEKVKLYEGAIHYDVVSTYPEATEVNIQYDLLYGENGTHLGYSGSYLLNGEKFHFGDRCILHCTSFKYFPHSKK